MKRFALFCLIASMTTTVAYAQDHPEHPKKDHPSEEQNAAPLPSPQELIEKSVKAIGGREKIDQLKRSITKMQMSMPQMGMEGTIVVYSDGKKTLEEFEITGAAKGTSGTDGEIYWSDDTNLGPRILKGKEKAQKELATAELYELHKFVESMETTGVDQVGGKPAYKVLMKMKHGLQPMTFWFDQESSLVVQSAGVLESPQGSIPVVDIPGDYREVEGVLMPHQNVQKFMGMEVHVRLLSVKKVKEHDEGRFDLPESIQKILEHQKQIEEEKEETDTETEETIGTER